MLQVVAVLLIASGLGATVGAVSEVRWGVAAAGLLAAGLAGFFVLDVDGSG